MAGEPNSGAGVISTATACQLLMLSRQRLDQLVAEGWITRHAPGQFRTVDVVQGYIRFMRDEGRRTSKSAGDSRVRDARAHEIELRVAERQKKLGPTDDIDAFVDWMSGAFRSELGGVPARCTRDLDMRRVIETELNGVLTRIADLAVATAAPLTAGRAVVAPVAKDDAGQVGDAQSDVPAIGTDPRPA